MYHILDFDSIEILRKFLMKYNRLDTSDDDLTGDTPEPNRFKVPLKRKFFNELADKITVNIEHETRKQKCPVDNYCVNQIKKPFSFKLQLLYDEYLKSKSLFDAGKLSKPKLLAKRDEFCSFHHAECTTIPDGIEKGYPKILDLAIIPDRLQKFYRRLDKIIDGSIPCRFKDTAEQLYQSCGKFKARQEQINNSHQLCGYYGWDGFGIVQQALQAKYKKLKPKDCSPQSPSDYMQFVLVPESLCCLISEDLKLDIRKDYEKLIAVLTESSEFGHILNSNG